MADHGRKARAGRPGAPSDLTLLAQAALTGSSDARDRFLVACRQYAYAAAIRERGVSAARRLERHNHMTRRWLHRLAATAGDWHAVLFASLSRLGPIEG